MVLTGAIETIKKSENLFGVFEFSRLMVERFMAMWAGI
jgi:hypothetical protein